MKEVKHTPEELPIPPRVGPHFTDLPREEQERINEADLKELAHYYGGWDELRKVMHRLEESDNEASWERAYNGEAWSGGIEIKNSGGTGMVTLYRLPYDPVEVWCKYEYNDIGEFEVTLDLKEEQLSQYPYLKDDVKVFLREETKCTVVELNIYTI